MDDRTPTDDQIAAVLLRKAALREEQQDAELARLRAELAELAKFRALLWDERRRSIAERERDEAPLRAELAEARRERDERPEISRETARAYHASDTANHTAARIAVDYALLAHAAGSDKGGDDA